MRLASRMVSNTPAPQFVASKVSRRNERQLTEELCGLLPVVTSALAGGATIVTALAEASDPASGRVADALRQALNQIEDGQSVRQALESLAKTLRHRGVNEFVAKLILATQLGTPVVVQLQELERTERQTLEQQLLSHASKAETRMLIPLVFLILPISVLFALYPSLSMLQNIN